MYQGDSGCCGDTLPICQYTATTVTAQNIDTMIIAVGGVNRTLTFPAAVGAGALAAVVQAAIQTLIVAQGYEDDGVAPKGVVVTAVSTNLSIVITGDVVPISITTATPAISAFDADCTVENQCTYTIENYAGGATNSMVINGTAYALGAITPGTTSGATVKTAVDGAFTSALITTGTVVVTLTGSGVGTLYTIAIPGLPSDTEITLGGNYLGRASCVQVYV